VNLGKSSTISSMPSSRLPSCSNVLGVGQDEHRHRDHGLFASDLINPLLEGLGTNATVVSTKRSPRRAGEIGRDQRIDRFDDFLRADGGPRMPADRRLAEIDVAAQAQLVLLHAVAVDAQDADVADHGGDHRR